MDPLKIMMAAGCFLLTALLSMMAQDQIIKALETGKEMRRQFRFPQLLFAVGWTLLVVQGSMLAGR